MDHRRPPWERDVYVGPARRRPKRLVTETAEPKEGPMQTLRIPDDAKQPDGQPGLNVTGRVCAPGATVRTKNVGFAKGLLGLGAELIEGPQGEKPHVPRPDGYNPGPRRGRVAAIASNEAKRQGLKGKRLDEAVEAAVNEWDEVHGKPAEPDLEVKAPSIDESVEVPTLDEAMARGYSEREAIALVADCTARRNTLKGSDAEAFVSEHLAAWDAAHPAPELQADPGESTPGLLGRLFGGKQDAPAEGESDTPAAPTDPEPSADAGGQVEEPGDPNAGEGAAVEDAPAEGESDGQSTGDADSGQAEARDTDKPDQSRRRRKKKSRRG